MNTTDTKRAEYFFTLFSSYGLNCLIFGINECGKTAFLNNIVSKTSLYKQTRIKPRMIPISLPKKKSSSEFEETNELHTSILKNLIRLKNGWYYPPHNTNVVILLDDVSMASFDLTQKLG